jgi:hypothetical protein
MTTRVWAGAAVAALALIFVVAACGGEEDGAGAQVASLGETTTTDDDSESNDDSTAVSDEDRDEAMLAFARCMREHGVDMPDPQNGKVVIGIGGPGKGKPSQAEMKKVDEAQKACAEHLEGIRPQISEEDRAEMQEAMLAYARCMREHGVDVPDPTFDGQGGGFRMRLDSRDDPDFEEAQKACQSKLRVLEDKFGGPRTTRKGS